MRTGWVLALALLASTGCRRAKVVVEEPGDPIEAQKPEDDPLVVHEAVREGVRGYVAALEAGDAEGARTHVVRGTFDYYEDLRRLALTATREELEKLDLMNVTLILQIRNAVTQAELESFDGATLFDRAVVDHLVGDDASGVPLDEVWLDEEGERAEIRIEGQPVVWLRLEDEQWRVDLPTTIVTIGAALDDVARERIAKDGRVFTALMLLQQSVAIDPAIVDGPLSGTGEPGDE